MGLTVPELTNATSFIQNKMEEVSFTTLFLFLFGAILVVIGTAETIKVVDFTVVIREEFRWLIAGMGFVFILSGMVLAAKKERSIGGSDSGSNPQPLYTFHGLKPKLRSHAVFQDFKIDKAGGVNRNAVYYMWADADSHNTIQASIENNNSDGHFLRIVFINNDLWLSNIAIHPISEQALDNRAEPGGNSKIKYRFLKISARVQKYENEGLDEIGIVLRICDRNLTYWEYGNKSNESLQIKLSTGNWQQKSVDLEGEWNKFGSDGNYLNSLTKPDFTVISGMVLVFGGYNSKGQIPKFGGEYSKGIIDIHEIFLDSFPANN